MFKPMVHSNPTHVLFSAVGRIKDIVIIRGRNYYPQDIEMSAAQGCPKLKPGDTLPRMFGRVEKHVLLTSILMINSFGLGGMAAFGVSVAEKEKLVRLHFYFCLCFMILYIEVSLIPQHDLQSEHRCKYWK